MKKKFSLTLVVFSAALFCSAPLVSRAQEKVDGKDKPDSEEDQGREEDSDAPEQMSPEEFREKMKVKEEADKATTLKMMKVFVSLEGEWIGREELNFEDPAEKDLKWKDQWKGTFIMGTKYFEMAGKTEGEEMNSEYKWICTYDPDVQRYRAWYFGENAVNQYTGMLSEDGKHVVWRSRSPISGAESEFTMEADGNRVKCRGTDKLVDGDLFSTQTSEYTRKRVDI